jgi:hypothetical protein
VLILVRFGLWHAHACMSSVLVVRNMHVFSGRFELARRVGLGAIWPVGIHTNVY